MGRAAQYGFEVLGVNLHPFRRDDHVFGPALKIQIALGVQFPAVAGMKPAARIEDGRALATLPVSGGQAPTAHQDFSIRSEPDFAPGEHASNRAMGLMKRVIDADQRRGFSQSVALHDGVTEPLPKHLRVGIECRSAGNKRPEFPAESLVDVAKQPPAPKEMFPFGGCESPLEVRGLARGLGVALDLVPEGFEHAGDGDERGNALARNGAQNLGGVERIEEDHRRAEERRNEQAHELPKHVAQRQEVKKTERVEGALGPRILSNFALQWPEVREDILMGEHHAPRLRRGARSKNDFDEIAGARILRRIGLGRKGGERLAKLLQCEGRQTDINLPERERANEKFGCDFPRHSSREFGRPKAVERHHHRSAEQASPKDHGPFRTILTDQKHAIAPHHSSAFEQARKLRRRRSHIGIGPAKHPRAAPIRERGIPLMEKEFLKVFGKRKASHGEFMLAHMKGLYNYVRRS